MNYFIDTEFIEDGETIELISIGIVREDGREYYAQCSDCDYSKADQWVSDNVLTSLVACSTKMDKEWHKLNPGTPQAFCRMVNCPWLREMYIGDAIRGFITYDPAPIFWAYYASYDWVVFCQLFGRMVDLPQNWPMYCRDLRQSLDERGLSHIKQPEDAPHHALSDARWVRDTWQEHIMSRLMN